MATKKKPTQLDRIEATLSQVYEELLSVRSIAHHARTAARVNTGKLDTILSGATFMQELDKAAPNVTVYTTDMQPEGLQPGDYTDASKETADALTAMGWEWTDDDRTSHKNIRRNVLDPGHRGRHMCNIGASAYATNHLDPATFLLRAAVTAKEIGLVPVMEEKPWEPEVGCYVASTRNYFTGISKVVRLRYVNDRSSPPCAELENGRCDYWDRLIPATEDEIAAHLAEQEARANAEKIAKLKAMKPGTPIKVKGKKQCTFMVAQAFCMDHRGASFNDWDRTATYIQQNWTAFTQWYNSQKP